MSQPFDLSRFLDLPPEVVKAFAAMQFELSVERAARQHEQAVVAEKEAFIAELKELVATLEGQVQQYRHAKFGPKSEKLSPAQLELALEDLETAIAETEVRIAAVEDQPLDEELHHAGLVHPGVPAIRADLHLEAFARGLQRPDQPRPAAKSRWWSMCMVAHMAFVTSGDLIRKSSY